MSTYFVWADSPSPGSGYLTKDTGAHSLTALLAAVTPSSGSIIEVAKASVATSETATIYPPAGVTIRSYGTDGTDRLANRPVIGNSSAAPFLFGIGVDDVSLLNLITNDSRSENAPSIYQTSGARFLISGCFIYAPNRNDVIITSGGTSLKITNNVIKGGVGLNVNAIDGELLNNTVVITSGECVVATTVVAMNNIFVSSNTITISSPSSDYNNFPTTHSEVHEVIGDPLFVSSSDYHLQASSPCIGTGASTSVDPNIPTTDYDGQARPQGTSWDIGAYEYVTPVAPPVASFNYNPSTGYTPLTVDFTSTSTGTISNYLFSFGDGTTSADASTSHTYVVTTPTYFTPSLTAMGPDGTDSTSVTNGVHVLVPAPVAGFTYAPNTGNTPLTVDFTNASTGIISGYTWYFGDTTTSTDTNPSHTYVVVTPTDFTSALVATGPGGDSTTSHVVHVGVAAPVAGFTYAPHSGDSTLSVQFTNTSTGINPTYAWTFGDGGTSTSASPLHAYTVTTTPTDYTATMTVTNPGGSDSTSAVVHVTVPAPVAGFTYNPHSGDSPLKVDFTNATTGVVSSYSWTFGDGASSSATSPSHTYIDATSEDHTVTLTATGPNHSNSASATVSTGGVPIPVITDNPVSTTVIVGGTLMLDVSAVGAGLSYSWLKDGVAIAGQTATTFIKNGVVASDAGIYRCQVDNAEGTALSAPATVTVQSNLDLAKGLNRTHPNQVGKIQHFKNGTSRADIVSYPGT